MFKMSSCFSAVSREPPRQEKDILSSGEKYIGYRQKRTHSGGKTAVA